MLETALSSGYINSDYYAKESSLLPRLKLTVCFLLTGYFTFFRSDKEEQDAEVEPSVLGLQSHWDSFYADELVNFHEQGDAGEIWLAT